MTWGESVFVTVILTGIVGACVALVCVVASYSCEAKWARSGRQAEWGPIQGCQVFVGDGWIPEQNFRAME